jgi:hypothetical protein
VKKVWFFIAFFVVAGTLFAQEIAIDMRGDLLRSEPSRDYFSLIAGNKRVRDAYDLRLAVQEEARRLRIRFIVYGTVYQTQTDENEKVDINAGCFLEERITESAALVSPLKSRYVKSDGNADGMNSLYWALIDFIPDTAASDVGRKYAGDLRDDYTDGVLPRKGELTLL